MKVNLTKKWALDEIARIMSGSGWSADTLDSIADIMRQAGYVIEDTDTED